MDRTLEEKKKFSGTFCCLHKSLRTGDVLTTRYDNITGIVSRIRNNHVEGPLSPKTALTVDPDRKDVKSIRLVCSYGRPVGSETLLNATRHILQLSDGSLRILPVVTRYSVNRA